MTEKTAQDKRIFDLTEVYDERSGYGRRSTDKGPQQIIVIDGKGYERVIAGGQNIHELTDVVDDQSVTSQINELVMKRTNEMIEKVVRELVPEIAERVIREEIEKIKNLHKKPSMNQD